MAKKSKSKNKSANSKQSEAQRRRDRKQNKKTEHENLDPDMKIQLEKIGLGLKDIPGDGNCLFRALADQLYGCQEGKRHHGRLRQETVEFMRRNKEDFEPFFACDEGMNFDRHLELLAEDGTYAGNDAIVAFSRRYEVVVVIHQLNEALWKIGEDDANTESKKSNNLGEDKIKPKTAKHWQSREAVNETKKLSKRKKQLHISYHNGDHYNSVRRLGDSLSTNKSADIFINTLEPESQRAVSTSQYSDDEESNSHDEEKDQQYSDYENLPEQISTTKQLNDLAEDVGRRTGVSDMVEIHRCLEENSFNVELTVGAMLAENARKVARKAKSSLWQDGGTGNRIFGNTIADSAVSKNVQQHSNMSNKPTGRRKANQRRKGTRRNDHDSGDEDNELERIQPVAAMQTLSI